MEAFPVSIVDESVDQFGPGRPGGLGKGNGESKVLGENPTACGIGQGGNPNACGIGQGGNPNACGIGQGGAGRLSVHILRLH